LHDGSSRSCPTTITPRGTCTSTRGATNTSRRTRASCSPGPSIRLFGSPARSSPAPRTCKIGNNCIIGSSTHVYDNAQVSGSVIGKRCVIGPGARVTDAYIFDDTVLGADVVVARSIVGSRVSVGPRSVVPRGCLVGDGVVLGEGAQLRPFERVGTQPPDGDDDDSDQEEEGPDEASERRNRQGNVRGR
jgi:NDP-sugar pyrophosphorylase family protein